MACGFLTALLLAALASTAIAAASQAAASQATASQAAGGGVACPLTSAELSVIVGKTLQRVNLSAAGGDPTAQCSFSALGKLATNRFVSPQVFLTVAPGGAADLRDLYLYYLKAHSKLAANLQFASRPDLGKSAFTLRGATTPITTTFFLVGRNGVGTLVVDLVGAAAGKRDQATTEKIFALVDDRLQ